MENKPEPKDGTFARLFIATALIVIAGIISLNIERRLGVPFSWTFLPFLVLGVGTYVVYRLPGPYKERAITFLLDCLTSPAADRGLWRYIQLVSLLVVAGLSCEVVYILVRAFRPVEASVPPSPTWISTSTPAPTVTPTQTPSVNTRGISATPIPTKTGTPPGRITYFCGYDRCKDSGEYGQLILETGIVVWNNPDPDRGGVRHTAKHGEPVIVIAETRVSDGPGGLWYQLRGGGWASDLVLADVPCTADNLSAYSFADCLMGKY